MRKLEVVASARGQRVRFNMQFAHVEIYVASAARLALFRRVPFVLALVMAGLGVLTLESVADALPLNGRSLAYLMAWTALSTVLLLYAFLGTLGSVWGKREDLDKLDPTVPQVRVSWKYVEFAALVGLAFAAYALR